MARKHCPQPRTPSLFSSCKPPAAPAATEFGDIEYAVQGSGPPVLLAHGAGGLQPYSHGVNTATRVPDAEFVSYEQGGHLLVLQLDDVREKVATFLRLHGPK